MSRILKASRKYKQRRTGNRFECILMPQSENVDFSRQICRSSGEQKCRAISLPLTYENFKVVHPKPTKKFWEVPQETGKLYVFCPDERIRIYMLLGKPAHGLSPPQLFRVCDNIPVVQNNRLIINNSKTFNTYKIWTSI